MSVYFVVRRKKVSYFVDVPIEGTVLQLKKVLEGITKIPVEEQMIHFEDKVLESEKTLAFYTFDGTKGMPQTPIEVGLAVKDNGPWELTLDEDNEEAPQR